MATDRLFLDTSFVQARFNRRDQYHSQALEFDSRLRACREVWTTEAVLLEIGALFRDPGVRDLLTEIWTKFRSNPVFRLVPISGGLLDRGMQLFRERPDKAWSLADCISFVVMAEQQLADALTCDHHFVQAGFRALLLDPLP